MSKLVAVLFALSMPWFVVAAPEGDSASPAEATPPILDRAVVTGRVVIAAAPSNRQRSRSQYVRRRSVPPQPPGEAGGAEDAFVYLEATGGAAPTAASRPTVITQRERTVMPHVSVAQVGQVVEFPNEDDVFHNLFSLSSGNRFALGRYAPGVTKTWTFEQSGVVRMFCDIHAEMAGVILVVPTGHVTRVGVDGTYALSDVPAGDYRVIAWHPTAGADTVAVAVGDGSTTTMDFTLRSGR